MFYASSPFDSFFAGKFFLPENLLLLFQLAMNEDLLVRKIYRITKVVKQKKMKDEECTDYESTQLIEAFCS
jgi:hypothetical protein